MRRLDRGGPKHAVSSPRAPRRTRGALDEDCSIERRIDYAYRTTDGDLKALDVTIPKPENLSTTTTVTGAAVPYIVRIETGTVNRAVYDRRPSRPCDPRTRCLDTAPGWNGRLIYTFGGGCVRGGSVATFGITRESPLGGPRYTANPNTLWIRRV